MPRVLPPATGSAILSEVGLISRDVVTIAAGQKLSANSVLGKNAAGAYVLHDPAASTSEKNAVAILYADTDATAADTKAVAVLRLAELKADELIFKPGITAPQLTAARAKLAESYLIVRD
ncbi:head decoration protein [Parachitinimonas caeni]|uniref:Head decoration protein n=1 Tax=Parachitinimonas caeni TaxID=3031301 RepID=A0ABT7DWP3_9NEIS|nr:head decoration protein [Parachitinimonas caeni]MDK2124487.1 head decoration protein [Parachitinimonas caeni]